MKPTTLTPIEGADAEAVVVEQDVALYKANGLVTRAAMEARMVDKGLGYALLRSRFPLILVIEETAKSNLRGLRRKRMSAEGILEANIWSWDGPVFSPVTARIDRIAESSGGNKILHASVLHGEKPDTRVSWIKEAL